MSAAIYDVQLTVRWPERQTLGRRKWNGLVICPMPPIDVNADVAEIEVPCTGNRHSLVRPAAEALAKGLTTELQIPTLP